MKTVFITITAEKQFCSDSIHRILLKEHAFAGCLIGITTHKLV